MIALDTNVLVRYLVQDDATQARAANRAITRLSPESPAFISMVVLCEVDWVLRTAYNVARDDCIHTLERILSISVFDIENLDCCRRALRAFREGPADFSDYLIRESARDGGYDTVLTFDKKALKSEGFVKP